MKTQQLTVGVAVVPFGKNSSSALHRFATTIRRGIVVWLAVAGIARSETENMHPMRPAVAVSGRLTLNPSTKPSTPSGVPYGNVFGVESISGRLSLHPSSKAANSKTDTRTAPDVTNGGSNLDFKVHVLLVVDTAADQSLTHGLAKAGNRMKTLIESLPSEDRARVRITELRAGDATPSNIRRFFNTLQAGPLDVVFFYYMGHGAVINNRQNGRSVAGDFGKDEGSFVNGMYSGFPESSDPRYLMLTMANGSISRLELYSLMLQCKGRAYILFCDCCGSFVNGYQGELDAPKDYSLDNLNAIGMSRAIEYAARMRGRAPSNMQTPGRINVNLWRMLIYNHMGIVDIGGAPVGYYGMAHPAFGGYSSFLLTETLSATDERIIEMMKRHTAWPEQRGMPGWSMLTTYGLAPEYCAYFPQIRSERGKDTDRPIHQWGPRLFDGLHSSVQVSQIALLKNSTIAFGLAPAGVQCRIQPGNKSGLSPGFYSVGSADGESLNMYNVKFKFEPIVQRQVSGITLIRSISDPRGGSNGGFGTAWSVRLK